MIHPATVIAPPTNKERARQITSLKDRTSYPIAFWRILSGDYKKSPLSTMFEFTQNPGETTITYKLSIKKIEIVDRETVRIIIADIQMLSDSFWESCLDGECYLNIKINDLGIPNIENDISMKFYGKLGDNNIFANLPCHLTMIFL